MVIEMARLNPKIERTVGVKKQYLGKVLIICEGETEFNYFNYFSSIINNNRDKYSHIEIEFVKANGNSKAVLIRANSFLSTGNNASQYHTYEKYLVFDCDAPSNIDEVIKEMMESPHCFIMLLTNLLFETWLLMHFEVVDKPLKKIQVIKKLKEHLRISRYTSKQKSSIGLIRKVIDGGDNVVAAISNAKQLEKEYEEMGYEIYKDVIKMNPYTTVQNLIEKILIEI